MSVDSESHDPSPSVRRSVRGIRWSSHAIGIDLGGTKIAFGAVDRRGHARGVHQHWTFARRGPRHVVDTIVECLEHCWGDRIPPAAAIGVGVAAQLDDNGTVLFAPNLRWRNFPLRSQLRTISRLPVTVINDVQAATYGEWKFGAGKGLGDLVCIFVGTGVGGGIVADGMFLRGASGTAGEVGHLTIEVNGRRCHCRNRGCLEAYVGGWAIADRAREAVRDRSREGRTLIRLAGGIGGITSKTVELAYAARDPLAREIVAETAEQLSAGLVSLVNALGPQRIVLGGGVIEGYPSLFAPLRRRVRARALRAAVKHLSIVPARLGASSGVIGSATWALHALDRR